MTAAGWQLLLCAGGMAALWAVPGSVWPALTAQALSGGMAAAWPLALGVAMGDLVCSMAAVLGLNAVGSLRGEALEVLRRAAAAIFVGMGCSFCAGPRPTFPPAAG